VRGARKMLFIHIGLPKTGTTLFQREIFPRWNNINFLNSNLEVLVSMKKNRKYLISNEGLSGRPWVSFKHSDLSWHRDQESFLENLSKLYPDAKIMVSFRRHDRYIISLYKQYLHEGGVVEFKDFFDIEKDDGFIKKRDLLFENIIKLINKYFEHEPFVFIQEELQTNFDELLDDMEIFFDESAPSVNILQLPKKNKGVGYYQAKILLKLNQ
jgi:hypothetical protein